MERVGLTRSRSEPCLMEINYDLRYVRNTTVIELIIEDLIANPVSDEQRPSIEVETFILQSLNHIARLASLK